MDRTAVNPWAWSVNFGFNQAELVEGHSKVLLCSGQTSVDGDGNPLHAGDMGAQVRQAVENLEAVLSEVGMTFANVVRLNIYTTDVDEFVQNYAPLAERGTGATTLLGVARLAFPDLMVELEATAVA